MSNGHGGARPGAGRPRISEKYAEQIESSRDKIANKLDDNTELLQRIAEGGMQTVQRVYENARTITVDDVEVDDQTGRAMKVKKLAFPEAKADEMVLVKETVTTLGPNAQVALALVEQMLGKPTQATEVSGPDGGPIETVGMTVDEWKAKAEAEAQARRAKAEQTLALLDESDETPNA